MLATFIKKSSTVLVASLVFSSSAFAVLAQDTKEVANITDKLTALKIDVQSVTPSAVDGLYEVVSDRGVYYVSKNAQFLVHGNVYDLNNEMNNITKIKTDAVRAKKVAVNISKIKSFEKDMIVYKAADERHVVTVFTDPTCGYCQKLHHKIAEYNKLGITVRYLAFPRGGINTNTYHNMVSIWCSEDPAEAMNLAKTRRGIPTKTCKNTVKEQYEFGVSLGINGTPAIILEDGTLVPGYLPPAALLERLEQQ